MTPSSPDSAGEKPAKRQRGNEEGTLRIRQEACRECRLRKVRCDKKRPSCDMCRVRDLGCEYLGAATQSKSQLDEVTSTLLDRLDRLHDDVQGIRKTLDEGSRGVHGNASHGPSLGAQASQAQGSSHGPASHATASHASTSTVPEAPSPSSRDFIRILAQRASADAVLGWDIFQRHYPQNALVGVLYDQHERGPGTGDAPPPPSVGLTTLDQECIPSLIDRFLQNVHTKNPILDVESLIKRGRHCADYGVGWDGWSCLVLLVCAVGSVAKPFEDPFEDSSPADNRPSASVSLQDGLTAAHGGPPPHPPHRHHHHHQHPRSSSAQIDAKDLQQGRSFFTLACRRLGSLEYSLLGAQCYFFAGVYLMYVLRPIQSWHHFHHASVFCHFYLRMHHGLSDGLVPASYGADSQQQNLTPAEQKARRLEQSLYWSCFKSECEFRVELPLPHSEISAGEFPNLFPSPPAPIVPAASPEQLHLAADPASVSDEDLELRRHAARLCNEEESWYYYLTEIALRRIGNRIINAFFQHDRETWINIKPLLRIAQEFEAQVLSWSANLPPVMKHYENAARIRAPDSNPRAKRAGSHVSRELSWAIDNRLLEMQTWLYQPFLYYLIHVGMPDHDMPTAGPSATASSLNAEDNAILSSLITSGITSCLKTIEARATAHRHHGLWFDLRSIMCSSLVLMAIVRSGNAAWIPGGVDELWGSFLLRASLSSSAAAGTPAPIGGKMGQVLAQFEFWADEAPDLLRNKRVLEALVRDVRGY